MQFANLFKVLASQPYVVIALVPHCKGWACWVSNVGVVSMIMKLKAGLVYELGQGRCKVPLTYLPVGGLETPPEDYKILLDISGGSSC